MPTNLPPGVAPTLVRRPRSKTAATWIAAIGGSFGLHRFYLYGSRDRLGWLHPWPTLIGLYGVHRARSLGQDDMLAWLLIPLLGLMVAATMLTAIVWGLRSDEAWNARYNPDRVMPPSGWPAIFGVVFALVIGAIALMATLAFSGQRFFEYQVVSSADQGGEQDVMVDDARQHDALAYRRRFAILKTASVAAPNRNPGRGL